MLLDKIDDSTVAEFRKKGEEITFPSEKYDIFYQYDNAAGKMIYLAVLKEVQGKSLPLGYYFSVGADLKVQYGKELPWFALFLYLREYEKTLTEEQQKALYGEAYYTLGSVAGLSTKELAERESARRSFLSFLDKLNNKGLLYEQSAQEKTLTLCFELMEIPEKSEPLWFRMKVGETGGKLYYVQNAVNFCNALKTGSELVFTSRFSAHLAADAFESHWQPLMRRFLELTTAGASYYFSVSRNHIPDFFALIPENVRGEALVSSEGPWSITEAEIPASVRMDDTGSLVLNPSFTPGKDGIDYVIQEKQMVVFYPKRRAVVLYHFETPVIAEIFGYFIGQSKKEIRYVSDIFVKRIVPVSSGIIRKSKENEFRITVHISLEDNALVFKTEYWMGEEKTESSHFEGKPFEMGLIRSYVSTLHALHGVENGIVSNPEDILFFLRSDLEPLRQVGSVYLDEKLRNLKITSAPEVQIRATRVKGWLNLSFYSKDYTTEELEAIYKAYRQKKNFFLLKDHLILLDSPKMKQVEEVIEEAGAEKSLSDVVLPFYDVMMLEGYREAGVDISMDQWVKKAVTEVVDYRSEPLELNEELTKVLRPYQSDGIRWMRKLMKYGFSGILADDMGLGKTLQVLAFLSSYDYDQPVLIVCPKSLVYNWRNEIQKWLGKDTPIEIIAGAKASRLGMIASIPKKGKTLYITGYDSLRTDIDAYEKKTFSLVLADEAQNVKNAATQKAKALRKVGSSMRLALTGTPVENSLMDLWSIFNFLMPGYMGSETDFRRKYETEDDGGAARAILARKVSPFLLRRSKEEVLDSLPGKEVILVTVTMADEQRKLYEAYLHKARELAKDVKGLSVLSALTRLRQICVDPSAFLEEYDEVSAKLSVALDQVKAAIQGGHRVLVFSAFTRVLEHFRYYLEEEDIRSYYISGDTSGAMRVDMAEKFNSEDRIKVMLISIKAGGTGLNLVGADTVIHLDPWWNFAVEEQATDRAYRIGQTKPVTVYKLICHDSIEEKVIELQEKKRQASSDVVHSSMDGIDTFSQEDIQYILE